MHKFYMELIIYPRWNSAKITRKFSKDLEKKRKKTELSGHQNKIKREKKTKRRGALTHGIMLLWYRNKQGCDGMSTETTFIK